MVMEKKSCTEKVCKKCGWCCTNLGKDIGLNKEEKEKLRKLVFEKSGVIYLRDVSRFYLAMSKEEKEKLEKRGKELGIDVDIKPNKMLYDKKTGKVIIYDYYLNHGQCPFYRDKECSVYEDRPIACRKFPNIDHSYSQELAEFVKKNNLDFSGISYEEALKKCSSCI